MKKELLDKELNEINGGAKLAKTELVTKGHDEIVREVQSYNGRNQFIKNAIKATSAKDVTINVVYEPTHHFGAAVEKEIHPVEIADYVKEN